MVSLHFPMLLPITLKKSLFESSFGEKALGICTELNFSVSSVSVSDCGLALVSNPAPVSIS